MDTSADYAQWRRRGAARVEFDFLRAGAVALLTAMFLWDAERRVGKSASRARSSGTLAWPASVSSSTRKAGGRDITLASPDARGDTDAPTTPLHHHARGRHDQPLGRERRHRVPRSRRSYSRSSVDSCAPTRAGACESSSSKTTTLILRSWKCVTLRKARQLTIGADPGWLPLDLFDAMPLRYYYVKNQDVPRGARCQHRRTPSLATETAVRFQLSPRGCDSVPPAFDLRAK